LEKWTPVIVIFLPVTLLLWPYHSNQHAIPHQVTKFRPNRATRCRIMMTCKMAAAVAQYSFRFRIWWRHSLLKVKIYPQIKFCQRGWDTTTSGLEKQTSAILEFFFPLQFWPDHSNMCAILHQIHKFRPSQAISAAE